MVKTIGAVSLFLILSPVVLAGDVPSPEDLRRMAQQADQKNRQKSERASAEDPAESLCAADPAKCKPKPVQAVPQVKKYNENDDVSPKPSRRTDTNVIKVQETPRGGNVNIQQDVLKSNRPRFGIRLGTVMNAEIRRNVSSAEAGDIEVWITKDVVGDKLTLPVGTQLFTKMRVNAATKRIDGISERAVTPEGEELVIIARVYDTQMVAGVSGIVNEAGDAITDKGVNRGLLAAARGALSNLDRSPAGQAVQQGSSSVLRDVDQRLEQETNTNIIIYAYPQPILLRVERSF